MKLAALTGLLILKSCLEFVYPAVREQISLSPSTQRQERRSAMDSSTAVSNSALLVFK